MLHALLHGKLTRALTTGRSKLEDLEDALTSGVLGRLRYLEPGDAWRALTVGATPVAGTWRTPSSGGEWTFWPRLAAAADDESRSFCEPDALWVGATDRVILEAKHHGAQDARQWLAQGRLLHQARGQADTQLLAVGGAPAQPTEEQRDEMSEIFAAVVHVSWGEVARTVRSLRRREDSVVLRDLQLVLSRWGYRDSMEFRTLPTYRLPQGGRAALEGLRRWERPSGRAADPA